MTTLITIIVFAVILTILVLVHEVGHYITAKKFGIKVEEFGIGLPPRAVGVKRKDMIFSLNWIPLGGFVKIKGEQREKSEDQDSFINHPIWQRGMVISSGVIMNVMLAMVLLIVGFSIGTPQVLDGQNLAAATVEDQKIRVASVLADFPSENVLEPGDIILTLDETSMTSIEEMQLYIHDHRENEITIAVERDSTELIYTITPTAKEGRGLIGVELITTGIVSYPLHKAMIFGVTNTFILLKEIIFAFGDILHQLFIGEQVSVDLSGPVGIAVMTSEVTRLGFIYLIQFAALLSLNLAIINFIPFPALDGGRFLFLMIEKIKGSAVNERIENTAHTIGFALLMFLIIFITYRDITKYQGKFESLWDRFTALFS